jgi:hypothetical protein
MKHEVAGADQAVIDLGFDAIQRDESGACRTKDTNADGSGVDTYARFVPYNNQEMASADTNKEVIIDSCSLDGSTERTYMSANPYSNPSNGAGATTNPAEARNNWWYVYYKFTAVDDAKILADQVFSMALSISKTSERSGGGTDPPHSADVDTGHTSGVTFYNDMTKVAIYVVDNDGGKAAVCKSRDCMVCTTYNDAGECTLVTDTTSEYLSTIPEVVEGEESVQFFLVLKVAPTKPVYITITPTSNVYVKIVVLVLLRSKMPVAL